MKANDIKNLKELLGPAFNQLKVLVIRTDSGARHTSSQPGWMVEINGKPLSSARSEIRVFASLNTVQEELGLLGLPHFIVVNNHVVQKGDALTIYNAIGEAV